MYMLIFVLCLLTLCLYGIQYSKGKLFAFEEWLDRKGTQCLRGASALFILLVHLPGMAMYLDSGYSKTWEKYLFAGYMVVGIFFMLSGYGLSVEENFSLKNFIPKRLGKLFIPYVLANIIYYIPEKFVSQELNFGDVLTSFVNGSPFVLYSWYIIAQLIFYILFYIAFSISKNKRNSIILLIVLQIIYMCVALYLGWDSPWWHGCLCFSLGVIIGVYKKQIYQYINNTKFKSVFICSIVLTMITYVFYIIYLMDINIFDQSAIFFVISVVLFSLKFKLNNKCLIFLGRISLEIYLYHGLVLQILKELMNRMQLPNIYIYGFATIFITIAIAWFINIINTYMVKQYLKLLK